MKFPFIRIVSVLTLCAVAPAFAAKDAKKAAPAKSQNSEKIDFNKVKSGTMVANVNGKKITIEEVFQAMQALPAEMRKMPMELLFLGTLDQLIDMNLLRDQSQKDKARLDKNPEVKEAIKRAIEGVYLKQYLEEITGDISLNAMKARYRKLMERFPRDPDNKKKYTDEVKIRQIKVKTKEEAQAVIKKLNSGIDFLKLAREKSTDEKTAKKDGAVDAWLNSLQKGSLLPGFDVIFAKKNKKYVIATGSFTKQPIKTPMGYYVLKVDDRRPFTPPKFKEVQQMIKSQLSQEALEKHAEKLRKKAKIARMHPNTGKPMKPLAEKLKAMQEELLKKVKEAEAMAKAKKKADGDAVKTPVPVKAS